MIVLISIMAVVAFIIMAIKIGFPSLKQLTKSNKIQLTIISIINIIIIVKLISIAWTGNDKGIIIVLFGHIALTVINAVVWLVLRIINRKEFMIYYITTLILAVLYIPTMILASIY